MGLEVALPAIVAGILGLVGVSVGAWLTSRGQEKRWLREKRLEGYLDVVAAAREFLWRGNDVGRQASTISEDRDALRAAHLELRHAVTKLQFLGPPGVLESLVELDNFYMLTLFDFFRSSTSAHGEPPPAEVQKGRDLMVTFQNQAKEALGVCKR